MGKKEKQFRYLNYSLNPEFHYKWKDSNSEVSRNFTNLDRTASAISSTIFQSTIKVITFLQRQLK